MLIFLLLLLLPLLGLYLVRRATKRRIEDMPQYSLDDEHWPFDD